MTDIQHLIFNPLCCRLSALEKMKIRNNAVRSKLKVFMMSAFMYWLVIFVVFCNSVSGAIQHYQQPQWITDVISKFLVSKYVLVKNYS